MVANSLQVGFGELESNVATSQLLVNGCECINLK